jgi:hypothetical protein
LNLKPISRELCRGRSRDTNAYDLDGRGKFCEDELIEFKHFFSQTGLDEVQFMEILMQPQKLQRRVRIWAEEVTRLRRLPPGSGVVLDALLSRKELARSELLTPLGVTDRHAGRMTAALITSGAANFLSSRARFKLAFPADLAGRWMSGLFPDAGSCYWWVMYSARSLKEWGFVQRCL